MASFRKIPRCLQNKRKCLDWQGYPKRTFYTLDAIDPGEATFGKLLIANRGEIACRIIKTAKKMGIKTVAVYSVADVSSRHVKLADEAVYIGPSTSKDSYLNISKIFEAIKQTGAEAVHPGYGFLSENATFVEMLEKKSVAFVGPSMNAIRKMGDKLESKRVAMAAGVNTIPGYDGIVRDEEHCVEISRKIGYPVMIKASAGGGGKGMRVARNDIEARDGFKISTLEAISSFGDSRMLVEKFIDNPRHIEIQILGDNHGNSVYLNERECSIQRRNQKVIEEAPSTFLDENTRKLMGEQSVKLCEKLAYSSAGTVEFLVDNDRNFYFLEMNTRLQVEHPVTEFTTGLDLVHQMIRVAKGHKLNVKQEDIKINGWAIECRVYAEDPYKSFGLPNIGRLYKYKEPEEKGVRCDSGVEEGSEISIYYDNMICKLIGCGSTRNEAIVNTINALDSYVIRGVTHNIPLLRDILSEENFQKGNISTNYLHQTYPEGFKGRKLKPEKKQRLLIVTAAVYATEELRNREYLNDKTLHHKRRQNWDLVISYLGQNAAITVNEEENSFKITANKTSFYISKGINLAQPFLNVKLNDESVLMQLLCKRPYGRYQIVYEGTTHILKVLPAEAANLLELLPKKSRADCSKFIKSPMPGLVQTVSCKDGDAVSEGQELCVIEAMKMQNSMTSSENGTIKVVFVQEGDTVRKDDLLVEME